MIKWKIDPVGITKARAILGLEHSVTVKLFDDWWWGEHQTPLHTIYLNSTIEDPHDVSWTAWHELGHAMQCERDYNSDWNLLCDATDNGYAQIDYAAGRQLTNTLDYDDWRSQYIQLPFEAEAEDIAHRYSDRYPLARL